MIYIQHSNTAGQESLFQKVDDSKIEERKENVRKQEEIPGQRQSVDRIDEQLDSSLSIFDRGDPEFSKTETPKPQIDTQQSDSGNVTEMQSQLDNQRNASREHSNGVASILQAITTMTDALNATNQRLGRVEEAVSMLKTEIFEAVANTKSMSDVLDIMKMDITTDIKEMRKNISSEMKITNQR